MFSFGHGVHRCQHLCFLRFFSLVIAFFTFSPVDTSKYKFFDIEDIPTPHFDIDDIVSPSTIDSEWLENECAFKDFSFELIVEYEHEQFELDFDTITQ